ncbi:MAG: hypothetical protein RJA49_2441 [Actinomycetota bacterium]
MATQWQTDGTFVFADISGFTKLSEQLAELGKAGAEELTVLLNGTFEALLGVARADGGDLVKFGGDALFLFFEGEAHAERACRAASGMRAALKTRGAVVTDRGRVMLRISMGVHSGPFLFVLAGDQQRELFVLGEHATTVTDMESAADAGEILVSNDTAAQLPASWLGAPKADGVLLRRVSGVPFVPPHLAVTPEVDAASLAPFVPRAIRRRLDDGEHSAEHRRTTVSFVHIGGVDALLRDEGAAVVAERLDRVVRVAVEAAERFEVTLLATDVAGGGIKLILTAGVPDSVEDGEGRMLGVGRALIDAGVGLPVRVGVNTGHVFAGEVGAPWRRVYTVMGDAVNLSARLMAKATPGELVASTVTLEQTATPFETTPLEPFMVKGKRHPQHAASVGRRVEGHGRDALDAASFVGRTAELAELRDALHRAIDGAGAVVEVLGEPGIGKSRLVRELIASAGETRVVRLTCEPFAADRPYFMSRVLLRTGLRIPSDATAVEAGRMLLDWLDVHAPEWLPFAPLLAAALDAEVPSTRTVDDLGADFRVQRLRDAAAAVLHVAFGHPLLLVVEDAMWMDEASALIIAAALQAVEDRPWFACFTTRDPAQGLGARLGYTSSTMELAPLDAALAESLAAELTDDAGIPQHELTELCARANGNPLFLLELAHARREMGSLDAIPGSLEDLVAARIDRLSPNDRSLLRHAAVLGDRFSSRLFDRTLGDVFPPPQPWHRLGDFVVVDQGEYRFAHDLVRRVAYAGLPFRRRRELHLRIGTALVPRGEPDDARLGLLALHFDGSGDHALAWKYNRLAGGRAAENYATLEATAFYDRAIGNAKSRDAGVPAEELAEVQEALADVAVLAGRYDLAQEGLRGARRLKAAHPIAAARLCRKEGKVRELLGQHPAAVRWYRRGVQLLDQAVPDAGTQERVEWERERGRTLMDWGSTLIWQQKYRQCVACCHRVLPHALAAEDRSTEAHAYYLLDWALNEVGDPSAAHYRELARPIYEEIRDYAGLASVLNNRGIDYFQAGQWDEAVAQMEQSRVARQRAGDVVGLAQCSQNLAEVCQEQGRYEEAEQYLREARRIWRSSGFAVGIAAVTNTFGRTVARSGRPDEGIALLLEAKQKCEELSLAPYLAETEARLAEAYLFAGRLAEADAALDALGDRGMDAGPPVVALALRVRGTVAARAGRLDDARRWLTRAREVGDKEGAEWESALACLELADLADTAPEERDLLVPPALAVLARLGVDPTRVLPPRAQAEG